MRRPAKLLLQPGTTKGQLEAEHPRMNLRQKKPENAIVLEGTGEALAHLMHADA
jgi:hypothetical protein